MRRQFFAPLSVLLIITLAPFVISSTDQWLLDAKTQTENSKALLSLTELYQNRKLDLVNIDGELYAHLGNNSSLFAPITKSPQAITGMTTLPTLRPMSLLAASLIFGTIIVLGLSVYALFLLLARNSSHKNEGVGPQSPKKYQQRVPPSRSPHHSHLVVGKTLNLLDDAHHAINNLDYKKAKKIHQAVELNYHRFFDLPKQAVQQITTKHRKLDDKLQLFSHIADKYAHQRSQNMEGYLESLGHISSHLEKLNTQEQSRDTPLLQEAKSALEEYFNYRRW